MMRQTLWKRALLPLLLFLLLFFYGVWIDFKDKSGFNPLSLLSTTIQSGFIYVSRGIKSLIESYILLVDIKDENIRLKARIQELEIKNIENSLLKKRVERLENMLNFAEDRRLFIRGARTIGLSSSRGFVGITIDIGGKDGMKKGLPVITSRGVLGYLSEVNRYSSMVLTVLDPRCRVSVIFPDTDIHAITEGFKERFMKLRYLNDRRAIESGKPFFTSGLDGIFPPNIPVGKVLSIEEKVDSEGFFDVTARPFFEFDELNEVAVIMKTPSEEKQESIW